MFTDNLFLTFKANPTSSFNINAILKSFELLTNLRINMHKSNVYFPNYYNPTIKGFTILLGYWREASLSNISNSIFLLINFLQICQNIILDKAFNKI